MMHIKKGERKRWALRCSPWEKTMGTLMPTSENKVAHTLRSTIKIREGVIIKGVQKNKYNQYFTHLHNFDLRVTLPSKDLGFDSTTHKVSVHSHHPYLQPQLKLIEVGWERRPNISKEMPWWGIRKKIHEWLESIIQGAKLSLLCKKFKTLSSRAWVE
jgi:hypothetical protein